MEKLLLKQPSNSELNYKRLLASLKTDQPFVPDSPQVPYVLDLPENSNQPGTSTCALKATLIYSPIQTASECDNNNTLIKASDLGVYAPCNAVTHKRKQTFDVTNSMMMMNLNENQQMPDQVVHILRKDTSSPTITVQLNGVDVQAILDTGASATILSADLLNKIGMKKELLQTSHYVIRTVEGHRVPLIGQVWINLCLGSYSDPILVQVMEQSPYELIIGIDVMIRFPSVSFNWKKRIFTCGTNNIPMSGLRHLTKEMQGRVQMSNTTVIPPRSVMRVDAKVSGLYTDRANLMFSPKELLEQRGISLANMLLDATCGLISIPITNVSFEPVTLHTGTTLGMLAADICLVENVPTDTDKAFVVKRKSKVEESEKTFLNENEQKALNNLLTKYVHLFAQNDTDVGRTHLIEHKIDTGDAS